MRQYSGCTSTTPNDFLKWKRFLNSCISNRSSEAGVHRPHAPRLWGDGIVSFSEFKISFAAFSFLYGDLELFDFFIGIGSNAIPSFTKESLYKPGSHFSETSGALLGSLFSFSPGSTDSTDNLSLRVSNKAVLSASVLMPSNLQPSSIFRSTLNFPIPCVSFNKNGFL